MTRITVLALVLVSLAAAAAAQTAPQTSGWVVLPVSDYRALHDKAYPPQPPPEPPPVSATITRVEYELAVQNDSAVGQARLVVDVFKDGWVNVPIPAGLRVRDAKIDGRPVTLITGGASSASPSVLLSKVGRSVITLDLGVPIAAKSGVESMMLPASPSPVQRVSLNLKSPELTLTVNGGFIAERTASAQATRFLVCGRSGTPLALSWTRRRDNPAASQPLRLRSTVVEVVGLAEDSAQLSAQVAVDVVQGLAERVTLKLPPAFAVSQVSGAEVADWEVRSGDLVVSFLEPVDRPVGMTITGEAGAQRDGKIAVPLIRVAASERESGGVAVEVLGAGEIKASSPRGMDAADPSDLGAMVAARQSPALVAFRSRAQAWDALRSLEVTVARYTPQAVLLANIEEARYTALLTEDGKAMVEAAYAVRNSQRSFLALTLPSGATLWSVSIDGRPVRPGLTADGGLLLPILKERRSSGAASIVRLFFLDRGARWPSEGTTALKLPVVDLPVSRTGLQVYHSPRFRLTLEPGPFRVEPYAPPISAALRGGAGSGYGVGGGIAGGVAGGVVGAPDARPTFRAAARAEDAAKQAADQELSNLVIEYQRASRSGSIAGLLPVDVRVPAIGPSIFAAAELTTEGKPPDARFTFKREVK